VQAAIFMIIFYGVMKVKDWLLEMCWNYYALRQRNWL